MTTVREPLDTGVPLVKVGGSDLTAPWYDALLEMRVELGYRLPARAVLRFSDPDYKLSSSSMPALGAALQVTVRRPTGPSSTSDDVVFRGFVTGMEVESFERNAPEVVVVAHDRAYRLTRARKAVTYSETSIAAIVQTIASRHRLGSQVKAPPGPVKHLMQVDSDAALLDLLADRSSSDWWVDNEVLHFAPRNGGPNAGDKVALVLGKNLVRLSVRATALHPDEVVVQGWDPETNKPVSATQQVTVPGQGHYTDAYVNDATRLGGTGLLHSGGTNVLTQAEAKRLATSIADDVRDAAVTVEGTVLRGSGIRPGCSVEVTAAGPSSGTYRVTAVEHVFRRRLETRFTAGPRRPTTLVDTVPAGAAQSTDVRRQGLRLATVTNSADPEKLGRVKVVFRGVADDHESDWARVLTPGGGDGRGIVALPEVGDEVLVGYDSEGAGQPIVLGGLFSKKYKPELHDVAGGKVAGRRWTSRRGHVVELKDGETPTEQHLLLQLEGQEHRLRIGKDRVDLEAPGGVPLSIKVGESSSLVFDGSGNVTLKGVNVKIEAQGSLSTKSSGPTTVEAQSMLTLEGKATAALKAPKLDVQASGLATITGAMVKIN